MPAQTIAIVDGNSLLHRAFHALPETLTAPDGTPTNAVYGFVQMLVKMVQELHPDGVVVAFDRGKPVFRVEALEQYKVQRPPTSEALKVQFPIAKSVLGALNVPVVEVEGWEGDDILGTLARRGREAGLRVLLVTGDRDAFQLVNDSVRVVTTKKGLTDITEYGPAEVEERYGIRPDQVADYLGLKGDTSDNIPGVPGIGEKTAARLLQEHGTLDAVLAAAPRIPGKLGENLVAHADAARASRTVATIATDVPLELDFDDAQFGRFDPARVAATFRDLRFTSLLDRVLALRSSAGTSDVGGEALQEASEASAPPGAERESLPPVLTGEAARAAVERWAVADRVGVSISEVHGESLFDAHRQVAVATEDAVALLEVGDAELGLRTLVGGGALLSAGDVKCIIEEVCPPDLTRQCAPSIEELDSARLFDCGIAAYLLESSRSSYDIPGLAADYLGEPLREPSVEHPASALEALAAIRLSAVLRDHLERDGSLDVLSGIEMPLVPVLARMERVGVGIDASVLQTLAEETAERIDDLRGQIYDLAGCEFTVDSPRQLGDVLFEKLGLPPQKRTKTGYSTDAQVLAALAPMHPIAGLIVSYRELTKLKSTYIDALPRLLGPDDRLHTSFNQTVAATGRLSSSNPNLQNIPVRTELGKRIRAAFVAADPGDLIVSADYSQIELRILAHLSGDEGLIDAFTSGEDFHTATAARVFGVSEADVPAGMRARAKAVNFGIVYGQTAHGLAESLGIGRAEAQEMIDRYYAAYPRVREFLDETVAEAHRTGYATTMFGRKRRIPELRSSIYNVRSFGERTAMNHPMQGTAADIMKLAMIEVDRRLRGEEFEASLVLQVHDELVFEVSPSEEDRLRQMVISAMEGVARLSVPLEVTVASGASWADAK